MKSAIQEEHRKLSVTIVDVVAQISNTNSLDKKINNIFKMVSEFQVNEINSLHCKFGQFMKALIFKKMTEGSFEEYIQDTKVQQHSRLSSLQIIIKEMLMEE